MTSPRASLDREPPVEWTLADLLGVFARRRGWILSALAFWSALALLYWAGATPHYRATAEIEVQKESHGAFGLENATADQPTTVVSDSFDDNLTLQTETGILESDAVTLEVIGRTGLEATPDYFAAHPGTVSSLSRLLFWQEPLEPLAIPLADSPNRRAAALRIFAHHRKIAPTAGTRLISIAYSDPDPRRAAGVVDALIQALGDYRFQARAAAAGQSASWLSAQLAALKQQTDAFDARAAALDRAAGDYGDDEAHNAVLSRLDALNAALSAAESNRIARGAIWNAVESGNPELISSLSGNTAAGADTQNAFALLQSLRAQETQAQAQLAESAHRYGENWPGIGEQRERLATIQKSIQDEVHRLGERAHSDYEVSLQEESSARETFNQQKDVAARMTGSAVAVRFARQEAEESRALYTSLLGRLQETGVLEGLHSGNFAVVSPALVPPPDHPTSPNGLLLATLAAGLGLVTGGAAAVARELTDTAIRTPANLEAFLDAPVFAAIPAAPGVSWYRRMLTARRTAALTLHALGTSGVPIVSAEPAFIESMQKLRATLLLSRSRVAPQIITVMGVSPAATGPRDGPSLALGLAAVLAQHGARTLRVEADLRSAPPPEKSTCFGLSEMLTSESAPVEALPVADPPLLSMIYSGARPPCPAELIASSRMADLVAAWREEYGFVVIESPPPAFADGLILAQLSDAVLLTARSGETKRDEALGAYQALSRQVSDHAVLGFVLEGSDARA